MSVALFHYKLDLEITENCVLLANVFFGNAQNRFRLFKIIFLCYSHRQH